MAAPWYLMFLHLPTLRNSKLLIGYFNFWYSYYKYRLDLKIAQLTENLKLVHVIIYWKLLFFWFQLFWKVLVLYFHRKMTLSVLGVSECRKQGVNPFFLCWISIILRKWWILKTFISCGKKLIFFKMIIEFHQLATFKRKRRNFYWNVHVQSSI